mgnify:CR=1 FL=1
MVNRLMIVTVWPVVAERVSPPACPQGSILVYEKSFEETQGPLATPGKVQKKISAYLFPAAMRDSAKVVDEYLRKKESDAEVIIDPEGEDEFEVCRHASSRRQRKAAASCRSAPLLPLVMLHDLAKSPASLERLAA